MAKKKTSYTGKATTNGKPNTTAAKKWMADQHQGGKNKQKTWAQFDVDVQKKEREARNKYGYKGFTVDKVKTDTYKKAQDILSGINGEKKTGGWTDKVKTEQKWQDKVLGSGRKKQEEEREERNRQRRYQRAENALEANLTKAEDNYDRLLFRGERDYNKLGRAEKGRQEAGQALEDFQQGRGYQGRERTVQAGMDRDRQRGKYREITGQQARDGEQAKVPTLADIAGQKAAAQTRQMFGQDLSGPEYQRDAAMWLHENRPTATERPAEGAGKRAPMSGRDWQRERYREATGGLAQAAEGADQERRDAEWARTLNSGDPLARIAFINEENAAEFGEQETAPRPAEGAGKNAPMSARDRQKQRYRMETGRITDELESRDAAKAQERAAQWEEIKARNNPQEIMDYLDRIDREDAPAQAKVNRGTPAPQGMSGRQKTDLYRRMGILEPKEEETTEPVEVDEEEKRYWMGQVDERKGKFSGKDEQWYKEAIAKAEALPDEILLKLDAEHSEDWEAIGDEWNLAKRAIKDLKAEYKEYQKWKKEGGRDISTLDFDAEADSGWAKWEQDKAAYDARTAQYAQEKKDFASSFTGAMAMSNEAWGMFEAGNDLMMDESWKQPREDWTAGQKRMFGYLYSTDPALATEYAARTNDALNREKQNQSAEEMQAWGAEHPLLATAANVLATVTSAGMADVNKAAMEMLYRGRITEDDFLSPNKIANEVVTGVTENLNEKYGTLDESIPVIGGKGLGDVYQIGLSMLNSMAAVGVGGEYGAITADYLFFSSAFASGIDEAKQRGLPDENAMMYGFFSGVNEALFEHLSADKLVKMKEGGFATDVVNALKQSGIEGSEEMFTEIANTYMDMMVNGDMSQMAELEQKYYDQAAEIEDENERREFARKAAWREKADEVAYATLSGAISGGGSAFGKMAQSAAMNAVQNNRTYTDTESLNALVESGLESPEGTESRDVAERVRDMQKAGQRVTNRLAQQLAEANQKQIDAETEAERENRPKLRGAAELIADPTNGQERTWQEQLAQVANEKAQDTVAQGLADIAAEQEAVQAEQEAVQAEQKTEQIAQESAQAEEEVQQAAQEEEKTFRDAAEEQLKDRGVEDPAGAAELIVKAEYHADEMTQAERREYEKIQGQDVADGVRMDERVLEAAQRTQDRQDSFQEVQSRVQQAATQRANEEVQPIMSREKGMQRTETIAQQMFDQRRAMDPVQQLARERMGISAAEQRSRQEGRTVSKRQQQEILQEQAQKYQGSSQTEMMEAYIPGQDAQAYAAAWDRAYQMGQGGINLSWAQKSASTRYLTDEQIKAAYEAGRKDAGNGTESNGVRQGSKWNDREDSRREARRMEESAAERRKERESGAESSTGKGTERVSAKELNIPNGTDKKTIRVRSAERYTAEDKAAVKVAEKNGLKITIVEGGAIETIAESNGIKNIVKANALIVGDQMYVRGDHRMFTTEQLARHEAGHKMIERGEVSIQDVRQQLRERYTEEQIDAIVDLYARAYGDSGMTANEIMEEIICDSMGEMNAFAVEHIAGVTGEVGLFLRDVNRAAKRGEVQEAQKSASVKFSRETRQAAAEELRQAKSVEDTEYTQDSNGRSDVGNVQQEIKHSLQFNEKYMEAAIAKNAEKGNVDPKLMELAAQIRAEIASEMKRLEADKKIGLPKDVLGNTYFANSSYDGSEENTTICPRSLTSEAFVDAVSEMMGRPLTVAEQIYISQDLQGRTLTPECLYCYVATDRKAYREFLGSYIQQRDAVIDKLKAGETDLKKLYDEFRDGRKDTPNMKKRFDMWVNTYKNGGKLISANHLTNMQRLMGDISSEFGAELKDQIKDAMAYAQSASWAKKRVNYAAYNNHILNWSQDRIKKLNSHYGLRMYSFSDFHPAFILENMQMITDASVRGLKMLAYTKDTDFVRIFAKTGMNINVSVFGLERNGAFLENNLIGAAWDEAKQLRAENPNVGITFVATSDSLVNWALEQDWIDVVIPYHLVRTGAEVAKALDYTNYTSESGDGKAADWAQWAEGKDKKKLIKSIPPTMHNNDFDTYMQALKDNHLTPRFERWIDNPNYMKLVNECRRSASESSAVQPEFDLQAAKASMLKLEGNGYYNPIGGSVERMYEIAYEVSEKMQKDGPTFNNEDVAYKAKYSREMKSAEELRREVSYLKRQVAKWKGQTEITKAQTANKADVRKVVKDMMGFYGSSSSVNIATENVQTLADYLVGSEEIDFQKVRDMARESAEYILQGAVVDANFEQQEMLKDLKYTLKTTPILINDTMMADTMDWGDFKRRNRYQMRFAEEGSGKKGTAMDSLWLELQDTYGEYYFPSEIMNPSDQLMHLEDLLSDLQPDLQNPYKTRWASTIETMTNDLIDRLLSSDVGQTAPTKADQIAAKAREEGFEQGKQWANEDWEDFLDLRVAAQTEEIRQKQELAEWRNDEKYKRREAKLRESMEKRDLAREAAEQNRFDRREANLRESMKKRDLAREAAEQNRFDRREAKLLEREENLRESMRKRDLARQAYAEERMDRFMAEKREQERRRIQRSADTQKRQQIQRLADKFSRMVTSAGKNDNAHVPAALKDSIVAFCQMFNENQQTGRRGQNADLQKRLDKLMEDIRKQGGQATDRQMEELAKLSRIFDANENARAKLAQAAAEYAKLGAAEDVVFDEAVAERLQNLQSLLAQKAIRDMTGQDLETIYNTMQELMHTVVNANKAFSMGKDKTITGMAEKWAKEIRQVRTTTQGMAAKVQKYRMWQMTPDTFFNYISGYVKNNEGNVVQKAFAQGEQRALEVQREYWQTFRSLTEDKSIQKEMSKLLNPKKSDYVGFGLKDRAGKEIKVSRGMMMQVYMMLEQEDSLRSLVYGGFRLPNMQEYYKGNIAGSYGNIEETASLTEALNQDYWDLVKQRKAIHEEMDAKGDNITQEEKDAYFKQLKALQDQAAPIVANRTAELLEMRDRIGKMLTPTEKKLIETAHKWYSRTGQMMRDVFLRMYGYEPKLVDNYVPIHRDQQSLQIDIRDPSQAAKALNLENMGATKERVRSTKPILLTDFFQELEGQKAQMARYVGFAEVQRDFNKLWKCGTGDGENINSIISKKFGSGKAKFGVSGEEYINHYIMDIAGGHSEDSILNSFYGNYAAATLRLNPRVAISQAASIPTAAAVVGWKNVAKGFGKGVWHAFGAQTKNRIAEENAWFWQRYRGEGGSTEVGDLRRKGGIVEKIANSKGGKALFNWCQNMDVFSTGSIMWEMAESYAQDHGAVKGSEGYEAAVNAAYTEILRKSQPNYTVTERSDLLRDKRSGMKMLTMFKTQSNQNMNILMAANGEFIRMRSDLQKGLNGVTKEDVKAARVKLANAYTSVLLGGTGFFVALRTAVNLAMGAVSAYRDDDTDEVTLAGILEAMAKEAGSSIAGMVAGGGQIYDFVLSAISGDTYYGISDSGVAALGDALTNMMTVFQAKNATESQIWKAVHSVCQLMGLPSKNAEKIYKAVRMYAGAFQGEELFSSDYTKKKNYQSRIEKYVLSGDEGKAADALAMLYAGSNEDTDEAVEKEILNDMKSYLKGKYTTGDVTDFEAEKILRYVGADDDAVSTALAQWDLQLEHPEVGSPKEKLGRAYRDKEDIPTDVLLKAYTDLKDIGTKQGTIDYINGLNLSKAQKKLLYRLMKDKSWKEEGIIWR